MVINSSNAGNVGDWANKYSCVELADSKRKRYRVTAKNKELYGVCNSSGIELIPCKYKDLLCMVNGYYLVMDYRNHWWVLKDADEAIYGPSIYGVDFISSDRDFLFYIEYNENAGFECVGIYDVEMQTITTDADYVRLKYIGNDTFEGIKVSPDGMKHHVLIDSYGNEK